MVYLYRFNWAEEEGCPKVNKEGNSDVYHPHVQKNMVCLQAPLFMLKVSRELKNPMTAVDDHGKVTNQPAQSCAEEKEFLDLSALHLTTWARPLHFSAENSSPRRFTPHVDGGRSPEWDDIIQSWHFASNLQSTKCYNKKLPLGLKREVKYVI